MSGPLLILAAYHDHPDTAAVFLQSSASVHALLVTFFELADMPSLLQDG